MLFGVGVVYWTGWRIGAVYDEVGVQYVMYDGFGD